MMQVSDPSKANLDTEAIAQALFSQTLSSAQLQQMSPGALAYLGDAVYELYIRRYYLTPPKRIQAYHHQVVSQVRAETQAHHLNQLLPFLTSTELDLLKRGRNAVASRPKRIDPDTYQRATSLETLIGYLYLSDLHRLMELLAHLQIDTDIC
ncbi:ribonuclease III [Phormidium sp. CLA17]|uniref:Mini-ribonuclease 3 n=1 Tax=Leptolyngbya sp. Cla-17 TaxID=2803751 RepID=UPI001490AE90|nr:ribonuclease III domain-containing protein [Leptolyngbya sp. Cla-17]MBM0743927.1 ribonuclease III [Leptolyngbya sp. Cla-17]